MASEDSRYILKIERDGGGVWWKPGSPQERDFVADATAAILAKVRLDRAVDAVVKRGVGIFKTESAVRSALDAVITETAGPQLRQAIRDGIEEVLYRAKSSVVPR